MAFLVVLLTGIQLWMAEGEREYARELERLRVERGTQTTGEP